VAGSDSFDAVARLRNNAGIQCATACFARLPGTVASRHGKYELADVLAGEQLGQDVREDANAPLDDVFA
jgi:hypothetical protein